MQGHSKHIFRYNMGDKNGSLNTYLMNLGLKMRKIDFYMATSSYG